jgi:hypothetical protein
MFSSRQPGRYVAISPTTLMPIIRNGVQIHLEHRRARRGHLGQDWPAGWYACGPWRPAGDYGGTTARGAAELAARRLREHDTQGGDGYSVNDDRHSRDTGAPQHDA